MITTLTLNPSLDRTFAVNTLVRGAVTRVDRVSTEAAGKGVNVARALVSHDIDALAVVPAGGPTGDELVRRLRDIGLPHVAVPIEGEVRANVSVVEADGTVTKLNEPGPAITDAELAAILGAVTTRCAQGQWVVASGSLPPGVASDVYAELARRLVPVGGRLAVDTSGSALAACLGQPPALLKPNLEELVELTATPITTLGDVVEAGRRLVDAGVAQVLISLGPQGALLVTDEGAVHGDAPVDHVANTVGAGDTFLAGYLAAGTDGAGALANALAWGRAAVRSATTTMAPLDDSDHAAVRIYDSVDTATVVAT